MDLEDKKEAVLEAISNLDWNDSNIPEVMEGFFNNPGEACELAPGEMSEDHIENLFELLECEEY